MAGNLGIPILRRSALGLDVPAHSRFETDDRTPATWVGSNLYTHPMFADPNALAANPFDVGDSATKSLRVNVVGGGAAGGTSSNFGAPFPASGTASGAIDSAGNMAGLNLDVLGQLKVVLPAGGGGLTDAQLRAAPVPISVAALPLPAGAATEATLATRASEATLANVLTTAAFQARINTLGQKAMAASTPVVLASDQSAIPVTGAFFQATQPISAVALPLPAGAATEATLATRLADATFTGRFPAAAALADAFANPTVTHIGTEMMLWNTASWDRARGTTANGMAVDVTRVQGNVAITAAALPLPAGAATEATLSAMSAKLPAALVGGRLDTNIGAWLGSAAPTVGIKASASSVPVVIASDQVAVPVKGDVDHDVINTLLTIQVGGHASPVQTAPAAVSATGDRVRIWVALRGEQVMRYRELPTYRAVYRLATRPYALSNAFGAAGRKQFATLYHINTSTKILRLIRAWAGVKSISAAAIVSMELVQLTAAVTPAIGNPAITPNPHRQAGTGVEAVALALPTTGGTEIAGSILAYREVQASAASALGTATNIPARGGFVTSGASTATTDGYGDLPPLYDDGNDREAESPQVPNGVAGGFAVVFDSNAIATVIGFVVLEFSEEVP